MFHIIWILKQGNKYKMAHKVTIGPVPQPSLYIPFGKEDRFNIYIYDSTAGEWRKQEYISFRAVKRLNQMSEFEIDTLSNILSSISSMIQRSWQRINNVEQQTQQLVNQVGA